MVSHSVAPAGSESDVGAKPGSAPHVPREAAVAFNPPIGSTARNCPTTTG